jgi:hypothetical protein
MLWKVRLSARTNAQRRSLTGAQHDAIWEVVKEFSAAYDWEPTSGQLYFDLAIDPMHLTPPHMPGGEAQFVITVAFDAVSLALRRAGVILQRIVKVEAAPAPL